MNLRLNALIEAEGLKARCESVGRFPWPFPQPEPVTDGPADAIVVGPAPCLRKDLARYPGFPQANVVFAVNRAVLLTPTRVDHIVTCHPDGLDEWTAARWQGRFLKREIQVHSTVARPGVDFVWGFNPAFGSSGGLAVFVALCLGYSRVFLAGIPLTNTGYADDPGNPTDYTGFHSLWQANLPLMRGRVFSLSGPETFTGRLLPLD